MERVKKPKRRKDKYNPYTLEYDNLPNQHIILLKESNYIFKKIEVSKEVYDAFNQFELEDISQMNKYDRHIEHSEIYENNLYDRSFHKVKTVEEQVYENIIREELIISVNSLPEIQMRRVKMYYFENKKLREIAKLEGCSIESIRTSIKIGIKKIKTSLEKWEEYEIL